MENDLDATVTVDIRDGLENLVKPLTGDITLDVTPVNDQTEATNVNQTIEYVEGESQFVDIPEKIVVSDVDPNEQITAKLTLSNKAVGSLTFSTVLGSSYNATTGVWTVTGNVAKVNAALEAVQFKPSLGNDLDATIAVDIRDGLEKQDSPVTGIITLDVTPVNLQTEATNLEQAVVYTEGAPLVGLTKNIVVTDNDKDEQITATLTLSDTSVGSLTATTNNGETYNAATGEWTITSTVSKVNLALAGMKFKPLLNNDQNATIEVDITDGLENDTLPLHGLIELNVTAVNDAPTATNLTQTIPYVEGEKRSVSNP